MPTKLKVNGKLLCLDGDSPALRRILAFLDKAPPDELFTADELGKRSNVPANYVDDLCRKPRAADYSQKVGRCKYYGNPKAIAELRRQMESR